MEKLTERGSYLTAKTRFVPARLPTESTEAKKGTWTENTVDKYRGMLQTLTFSAMDGEEAKFF
jgi:hypothetical protein